MSRNLGSDSRFASAFATLVCAWVVALVVIGLSSPKAGLVGLATPPVVAAAAGR